MQEESKYGRPTYQYNRRLGGRTRKTTVTILDTHIDEINSMIVTNGGSVSGIVGDALDMYLSNNPLILKERAKEATIQGKNIIAEIEYIIDAYKEKESKEQHIINEEKRILSEAERIEREKQYINFGRTLFDSMQGKSTLWYKNIDEWHTLPNNEKCLEDGYVKKNQVPSDLMKYYEAYVDTL